MASRKETRRPRGKVAAGGGKRGKQARSSRGKRSTTPRTKARTRARTTGPRTAARADGHARKKARGRTVPAGGRRAVAGSMAPGLASRPAGTGAAPPRRADEAVLAGRVAGGVDATPAARAGAGPPRTGRSAKWVDSPEVHADRPGQSLATRSHDVIRRWAESRGATPAAADGGRTARALRLGFPGYGDAGLAPIGWEEWFRTFDDRRLVFLFQEHKKDGIQSNFFRLDTARREHPERDEL